MSDSAQILRRANADGLNALYNALFTSAKAYEVPEIIEASVQLLTDALLAEGSTTLERDDIAKKIFALAEDITVS